jgi:hypothetical protein
MSCSSPRLYDRNGASDYNSLQNSDLGAINECEKSPGSAQSLEAVGFREREPQPSTLESSTDSLSGNHLEQKSPDEKCNPPPLTSGSSFKSLRSNHVSLKSGRSNNSNCHSNNSKKSGGSGGSRGSIGTMKSFQSSRNPILELLRDEVHTVSPPLDTEDEEPSPSKWPVLGFIGFLVVLTLICAVVEVALNHSTTAVIFFTI